jgi:hypothetical protein
MLGTVTTYAIRSKLLKIEDDRHGFGWNVLPTSAHIITSAGLRPRYQLLPRPAGISPADPPHTQIAAYAAAAATRTPVSVTGTPIAVSFTAEMCPRCLAPRWPLPIHRRVHHRRHRPTMRILVAVDIAGSRYYLQRDRDDDAEQAMHISPPQAPDDTGEQTALCQALTALLIGWRTRHPTTAASDDSTEKAPCRTPGCDGDPDDGEGWDGYCGTCADRFYAAELSNEDAEHGDGHGVRQCR